MTIGWSEVIWEEVEVRGGQDELEHLEDCGLDQRIGDERGGQVVFHSLSRDSQAI